MGTTIERMNNFLKVFGAIYDTLYADSDLQELNEYLIDEWEDFVADDNNKKDLLTFCNAMGDIITSDREVIAYMLLVRMFDIGMVCNECRMEVE